MSKCKIKDCERMDIHSKKLGLCPVHYARWYRKNHNDRIQPTRHANYVKNKERRLKQSKEWKLKNKERSRELEDLSRDKIQFGGNKRKALLRDNFECQECGLNQEQHIIIFGCRLTVHHIDGNGYGSENPNNSLDNLETLCLRCHRKRHLANENEPNSQADNSKDGLKDSRPLPDTKEEQIKKEIDKDYGK